MRNESSVRPARRFRHQSPARHRQGSPPVKHSCSRPREAKARTTMPPSVTVGFFSVERSPTATPRASSHCSRSGSSVSRTGAGNKTSGHSYLFTLSAFPGSGSQRCSYVTLAAFPATVSTSPRGNRSDCGSRCLDCCQCIIATARCPAHRNEWHGRYRRGAWSTRKREGFASLSRGSHTGIMGANVSWPGARSCPVPNRSKPG